MDHHAYLRKFILKHPDKVSQVVDFHKGHDRLFPFDFTAQNPALTPEIVADTAMFTTWVNTEIESNQCRYGIGGYGEHRTVYARSTHFDQGEEPRRFHLGTDIWGPAGTPVYCPLDGRVHSFRFNNNFGDYGSTIILEHDLEGLKLHTLYGHLDLASLSTLREGQIIRQGQQLAHFGVAEENGFWPPHLHFQLILDMENHLGDYPGVCRYSERKRYLDNCPDPDLILRYNFN